MARGQAGPPTHYATADIERRHERHTCPRHPEPGVCVGCGQEWPCDVRRLLDLTAAQKFAGTLVREARWVVDQWDRDWDAGRPVQMGRAVARLARVLDAIDGKRSDPLEQTR